MDEQRNAMAAQVFSLPELIRGQYEDLEPKTRKALTTPEIFSIQKIVLTGCGDSWAAALSMKGVFEALTRLPVEAVTAIDLARFHDRSQLGFAPLNPLVIAISNSGTGARVDEAVQRAVKHGAFVLGVTGDPDSALGKHASRIVKLDIPHYESAPGTRTYAVSLIALLLLAIRIGEVHGRYTMDKATALRGDIKTQADLLESMLPDMDAAIARILGEWNGIEAWDFIGAGPDYGSAWYGHAKIFEAAGQYAMHINTEEWMHLNFFMRRAANIGTVLVVGSHNAAISRAKELLGYAPKLGRPLLVVTDAGAADLGIDESIRVPFPGSAFAESSSIAQFAPLSLIAAYQMQRLGEIDGRGCSGPWSFCAGGAAVKNSQIVIL